MADYITLEYAWYDGPDTYSYRADLPYPKKFEMQKTPFIVSEFTTMTGQTYADVIGWKWADTTIEWGALYPHKLENLVWVINYALSHTDGDFRLTFKDNNNQDVTVKAIIRNFKKAKTLVKYGDHYVWDGVSLELSFPECYQS